MSLANCWTCQEYTSSVRRGWELLCQTLPPEDSHLTPAWLLCSKSQPLNVAASPECVIWAELNISRADKNLSARLIMHWLMAPHAVACPKGRQLCTEVTFLLSWPPLTKDGKCQRNRAVPVTIRGNFTSWLSVLEGAGIYRLELKSLGDAWTYLPWYGWDDCALPSEELTRSLQLYCSFQSLLSFGLKFPRAVKIRKEWQWISWKILVLGISQTLHVHITDFTVEELKQKEKQWFAQN